MTGSLGRWALKLEEYSFTVVHKSVRLHQDADSLSRYPVDTPDRNEIADQICSIEVLLNRVAEKQRDEYLRRIIERLRSPQQDPSLRLHLLKDGTLHNRNLRPEGPEFLIFVPEHLELSVLRQLHDEPTAGHLGFARTYDRVRR